MAGQVHTVPRDGGWINEGGGETIGVAHDTKDTAIEAGRAAAREREAEHVIHNQDGTIGEKNSYGNDPRDVPG
ncbi:MAG: DUF2188 domain-containing protein [Vicinamibacterales bacterium]